jgi:type IV pilus assembly protein PilX
MTNRDMGRAHPSGERGASLVVVMMVLLVVTVLGIAGSRLALLGEASARHDRDKQIAFEAAEAAIVDAQNDIDRVGSASCAALRAEEKFNATQVLIAPGTCQSSSGERGMCAPAAAGATKPTWAAVDFLDQSGSATTVEYGTFTCRTFDTGAGVKPARPPRYVVEIMEDKTPGTAAGALMYRITAMGFGPRVETRAVVQVEYRKRITP